MTVKSAAKGVVKRGNDLSVDAYRAALEGLPTPIYSNLQFIDKRQRTRKFLTSVIVRSAKLNALYVKRRVCSDNINTTPID